MKKTTFVLVLIVAITLFLSSCGKLFDSAEEVVYRSRNQLETQALRATQTALLRHGSIPEWDTGVYVSRDVINRILKSFVGLVVEVDAPEPFKAVEVTVQKAAFSSFELMPLLDLALTVSPKNRKLEGRLDVKAEMIYRGISIPEDLKGDPSSRQDLRFGFRILEARPSLRTKWFTWVPADKWAERIGVTVDAVLAVLDCSLFSEQTSNVAIVPGHCSTKTTKDGRDPLGFGIPLPRALDVDPGIQREESEEYKNRDDIVVGRSYFTESLPMKKRSYPFDIRSPLFLDKGVWFVGEFGFSKVAPSVAGNPKGTPSPLSEDEYQTLRKDVLARLRKLPASSADLELSLKAEPLVRIVRAIGDYPAPERTYTVRGTKIEGSFFLHEQEWRDDHLGKGGFNLRFADSRPYAQVVLQLGKPTCSWKPGKEIRFGLPTDVRASAALHWHLDPIVGGGAGGDIGLEGTAKKNLTGRLAMHLRSADGIEVVTTDLVLNCEQIPVSITTDGKLVTDLGWAKVPKIGINSYEYIGDKGQHPDSFFMALPELSDVFEDTDKVRQTSDNRTRVMQYDILKAEANKYGFSILANVAVETTDFELKDRRGIERQRQIEEKRLSVLNKLKEIELSDACPERRDAEIKVGKIVFGTPNQIGDYVIAMHVTGSPLFALSPEVRKLVEDSYSALAKEAEQVRKRVEKGQPGVEDLILPQVTAIKVLKSLFR